MVDEKDKLEQLSTLKDKIDMLKSTDNLQRIPEKTDLIFDQTNDNDMPGTSKEGDAGDNLYRRLKKLEEENERLKKQISVKESRNVSKQSQLGRSRKRLLYGTYFYITDITTNCA